MIDFVYENRFKRLATHFAFVFLVLFLGWKSVDFFLIVYFPVGHFDVMVYSSTYLKRTSAATTGNRMGGGGGNKRFSGFRNMEGWQLKNHRVFLRPSINFEATTATRAKRVERKFHLRKTGQIIQTILFDYMTKDNNNKWHRITLRDQSATLSAWHVTRKHHSTRRFRCIGCSTNEIISVVYIVLSYGGRAENNIYYFPNSQRRKFL